MTELDQLSWGNLRTVGQEIGIYKVGMTREELEDAIEETDENPEDYIESEDNSEDSTSQDNSDSGEDLDSPEEDEVDEEIQDEEEDEEGQEGTSQESEVEKEEYDGPSRHGNTEPSSLADQIKSTSSDNSSSDSSSDSQDQAQDVDDTPVGIEGAVNNLYARAFIMDLDPDSEEAQNYQDNLKEIAQDVDLGKNAERVIQKYLDNFDELTPEQALLVSCGMAILSGFTVRPEKYNDLKNWLSQDEEEDQEEAGGGELEE